MRSLEPLAAKQRLPVGDRAGAAVRGRVMPSARVGTSAVDGARDRLHVVRVDARAVTVADVVDGVIEASQQAVGVSRIPHIAVQHGRASPQLELGVPSGIERTHPHPAATAADGDVCTHGPCQVRYLHAVSIPAGTLCPQVVPRKDTGLYPFLCTGRTC